MTIEDAQRDVRRVFLGGFPGQLSSGLIWLASAAVGTWGSERGAILILVIGGAFIFPVAQMILRLMRRPAALPPAHPMNQLAMQVAFLVPLQLPLVGAAALYRLNWFYPALMIVVYASSSFVLGGWLSAIVLLAFALWGLRVSARERSAS